MGMRVTTKERLQYVSSQMGQKTTAWQSKRVDQQKVQPTLMIWKMVTLPMGILVRSKKKWKTHQV